MAEPVKHLIRCLLPALLLAALAADNRAAAGYVKYADFLEKPTATRKGDSIDVNLGFTAASACWVKASVKIQGNVILLSGKLTLWEIPQRVSVKLPDPGTSYRVFWRDGYGKNAKQTEIKISGGESKGRKQ